MLALRAFILVCSAQPIPSLAAFEDRFSPFEIAAGQGHGTMATLESKRIGVERSRRKALDWHQK
jgi:hypothetical protein